MLIRTVKLKNMVKAANTENVNLEYKVTGIKRNDRQIGCSGFVINKDNGRICYVNTDPNWNDEPVRCLVRRAPNSTSYSNHEINNFVKPENTGKAVIALITGDYDRTIYDDGVSRLDGPVWVY
ncbi:hypothetical protein ACFBZI_11655 [Moraxella sp. ZJ142]|uniref:hypothetical protein n=1 Tax=Moraxella marmotae TaxID=3344520 RepID=UPI0035D4830A